MCGLTGVYHFGGAPVDRTVLRAMRELQDHRGPDDHGMRLFSLRDRQSVEAHAGAPHRTARSRAAWRSAG